MVAHLTLIAVCKESSSVDVGLPEGLREAFAPQVVACVSPRKAPSLPDGFEGVRASVRPFSGFPASYEAGTPLFLCLRLVGPRSSLVFCQNVPHSGILSDLGASSEWSWNPIVKDNPNILRLSGKMITF